MIISQIIRLLLFAFIAIVFLGVLAVLFSIGIVVLWYLLLFALALWIIRRLYYFFKGEKPPSIVEQYYSYNNTDTRANQKKNGRVIDYDEYRDK